MPPPSSGKCHLTRTSPGYGAAVQAFKVDAIRARKSYISEQSLLLVRCRRGVKRVLRKCNCLEGSGELAIIKAFATRCLKGDLAAEASRCPPPARVGSLGYPA